MPIKLIKSCFFDEAATKKALCEFIMGASQLSIGEQCRRFEASFAAWQGSRRCVFLNSGSSANLALVQAYLNLKRLAPGDAVAFSALTWATNVMPLVQLGLDPVPVDVETDTLNVSPRTLAEAYARKPFKALFLTNLLGFCDDLAGVADFCRSHGVRLLEDNCESMGSVFAGRKLGSWGEAGTFSTFVGHHMSTVEGGMVCTDDEELYEML